MRGRTSRQLRELTDNWQSFGESDPLWAILSHAGKRGNRWDLDEFLETGEAEITEVLLAARTRHPQLEFGRALDFGCGVGRLTQALARRFSAVDGVDIAAAMVAKANAINQFPDRCRYHCNTAPDLRTFQDGTFDFAYSNLTLQHMPPRLAHGYLAELCRVLAPTGLLVFDLPVRPRRSRSKLGVFASRILHSGRRFWHRKVRSEPVMDMFGTKPEVVTAILAASGCRTSDEHETGSAGPDWISRRYYVVR